MTVDNLVRIRRALGLSQTAMAQAMGLSMRTLQDIEAEHGETEVKLRHALLVERVSLSEAVRQGNPALACASIERDARELARLERT